MEGPGQVFYGSAPAAAAATAEAIDDHSATLGTHATGIATNATAITATNAAVAAINQVPSGMIAAFETLTELTAAGAGWARYTAADGRLLIGAGTTFSQTFAQATNYGANWTPFAGGAAISATAADQVTVAIPGTQAVSATTHQHNVTLAAQTWLPVARGIIWGRKT
jgi:hypothetical protein